VPDAEKRKRAEYVIDTSASLIEETRASVARLLEQLAGEEGSGAGWQN
jgi:hypothetical protein